MRATPIFSLKMKYVSESLIMQQRLLPYVGKRFYEIALIKKVAEYVFMYVQSKIHIPRVRGRDSSTDWLKNRL